jgi:hypothetical protein
MYTLTDTTPDLLVAVILVVYLGVVVGADYPRSLWQGAACGLLGALAYLAKAYAFPFFLAHFLAVSVYLLLRRRSSGEEVQIGTKKVMTRTLEDLLPEDLDFLKIDIDGMEGALLLPLVHFIQNKNIRIFIEVESEFLLDYEREMRAIGYAISHRTDHGNYSNLFLQRAIG